MNTRKQIIRNRTNLQAEIDTAKKKMGRAFCCVLAGVLLMLIGALCEFPPHSPIKMGICFVAFSFIIGSLYYMSGQQSMYMAATKKLLQLERQEKAAD